MKTADFDYTLPPEAIAQEACEPRDHSRLLHLDREGEGWGDHHFYDLPALLQPGDLLVLNDTRVNPWRLVGHRPTGGRVECLILELRGEEGEGFFRPSRKLRVGDRLAMEGGALTLEIAARRGGGKWSFTLRASGSEGVEAILERVGRPPLPPYIKRADTDARTPEDRLRYQTIFARSPGAVAAPTAGLHMTDGVLAVLEERGVEIAWTTLHVGAGTFLPVECERLEDHVMHRETYTVPPETAVAVARVKAAGGRVVALGTTVVRTLETSVDEGGALVAGAGESDIFIYPGYAFRVVDGMVTNFHLPQSTLLMLVCAFAGRERVLAAYGEALERGYRFYSYGDGMVLL